MMSRAWERGRLARIAGKDRKANPYGRRRRENVQWLAGWLYQDERSDDVAATYAAGLGLAVEAKRIRALRGEGEK